MSAPLPVMQVQEAIACLKGEGPPELKSLVCSLIGDPRAPDILSSGAAYEVWERMVVAQGGRINEPLLGGGCSEVVVEAPHAGTLQRCDALLVGQASVILGGGRTKEKEAIDHGVGIFVEKQVGFGAILGGLEDHVAGIGAILAAKGAW